MTNRERALFTARDMLKPDSPHMEQFRNVAQELLTAQAQIDSLQRVRVAYNTFFMAMSKDLGKVSAVLTQEMELLK